MRLGLLPGRALSGHPSRTGMPSSRDALVLGLACKHVVWPGPQGRMTDLGRAGCSQPAPSHHPSGASKEVSRVILPGSALSDLFFWQLWLRVGRPSPGVLPESRWLWGQTQRPLASLLPALLLLRFYSEETVSRLSVTHR